MAVLMEKNFPVEAGAYESAGEASTTIKRTLKQLGVKAEVLRHVSVACYEVELNLVIHSLGGTLTLQVEPDKVTLISKDVGPGHDRRLFHGQRGGPDAGLRRRHGPAQHEAERHGV